MVSISIDISELTDLSDELENAVDDIKQGLRNAIVQTAYKIHGTAVKKIARDTKTGYVYDWRAVNSALEADSFRMIKGRAVPVKNRSKPHRASREGEAPASDTGNLVNSLRVYEKTGLRADVIANAKYSGYLESTTNLNRPFLAPSVEESMEFLEKRLAQEITRVLNG
jgi:hypothetical protein